MLLFVSWTGGVYLIDDWITSLLWFSHMNGKASLAFTEYVSYSQYTRESVRMV